MTLIEFLAPIRRNPIRDKCLATMYYQARYISDDVMTVDQLRALLVRARVPRAAKANLADTLYRAKEFVDSPGTSGRKRLWRLTKTGEDYIRNILDLPKTEPEIEHDVGTLSKLVASITNTYERDYFQEALKCLQVGALRATVVFVWSGTIRRIQQECLKKRVSAVNSAVQRHDSRARTITNIDDFSYIKDSTALLASQDLGIYDKSQRQILEQALVLRNKCGHPGKYSPGPKRVSSFIEDIIGIVYK